MALRGSIVLPIRQKQCQVSHRPNPGGEICTFTSRRRDQLTAWSSWVPRAGLLLLPGPVMAFSAASPANAAPQPPSARMSEFTNARAVRAAVEAGGNACIGAAGRGEPVRGVGPVQGFR